MAEIVCNRLNEFFKNVREYRFVEVGLCYDNIEFSGIGYERKSVKMKVVKKLGYYCIENKKDILFKITYSPGSRSIVNSIVLRCNGIEAFGKLNEPKFLSIGDTFRIGKGNLTVLDYDLKYLDIDFLFK